MDVDLAVLSPQGAALLVRVIDRYSQVERVPLGPSLRNLREGLARLASARCGTTERSDGSQAAPWSENWISVTAAAERLGCSREYLGRRARAGHFGDHSPVVAGVRYIDRLEFDAHLSERRAAITGSDQP